MATVKGFFDTAKFNFNDVKVIVGGATLFLLLKQEIHDNKTNYDADQRIINYRLSKIEDCCNLKTQVAILPKETNIETERK